MTIQVDKIQDEEVTPEPESPVNVEEVTAAPTEIAESLENILEDSFAREDLPDHFFLEIRQEFESAVQRIEFVIEAAARTRDIDRDVEQLFELHEFLPRSVY